MARQVEGAVRPGRVRGATARPTARRATVRRVRSRLGQGSQAELMTTNQRSEIPPPLTIHGTFVSFFSALRPERLGIGRLADAFVMSRCRAFPGRSHQWTLEWQLQGRQSDDLGVRRFVRGSLRRIECRSSGLRLACPSVRPGNPDGFIEPGPFPYLPFTHTGTICSF
jgi:hypothetical protein